jgi:YopX protein
MRQPKFKGYSIDTGSWHTGHGWFEIDYTEEYKQEKRIADKACLYTDGSPVECELSSMGEYTGRKDVHKNEIYEGDVVHYTDDLNIQRTGVIVFRNGSFAIENPYITSYRLTDYEIEVIGNKYIPVRINQ